MRTVHKYPLTNIEVGVRTTVTLPRHAQPIHTGVQHGERYVWALVDTEQRNSELFSFIIVGTGDEIPVNYTYVTTWFEGPFVWHLVYKRLL